MTIFGKIASLFTKPGDNAQPVGISVEIDAPVVEAAVAVVPVIPPQPQPLVIPRDLSIVGRARAALTAAREHRAQLYRAMQAYQGDLTTLQVRPPGPGMSAQDLVNSRNLIQATKDLLVMTEGALRGAELELTNAEHGLATVERQAAFFRGEVKKYPNDRFFKQKLSEYSGE